MDKIKLFCFPFAGSSALYYKKWQKYLRDVTIVPVELAGKGMRISEEPYNYFDEVLEYCKNFILSEAGNRPFAFFGHSMGACIAYELYHLLPKNIQPGLVHVFISGRKAPNCSQYRKKYHHLPHNEFVSAIFELGGVSTEILEYEDLFEQFLYTLRNDMKLLETYQDYQREKKMDCDLTVFNGKNDIEIVGNINDWRLYTNKKFSIYEYSGGHFFIDTYWGDILRIINQKLKPEPINKLNLA